MSARSGYAPAFWVNLIRARTAERSRCHWAFGALVVAYVCGFTLLLVGSRGLPYLFDNNESFSAFLQGRNLVSQPLAASAGLADEAVVSDPAAHPYVYTHGGELPRFFAAILYVLGAREVEPQIAATVMSLGVAALYLMYRFFRRLSGSLFAVITCLIFFTDYILFVQWQVDTWRIWQALLLFATLVCVQEASSLHKRWIFLSVVVGFCLTYLQLVFAAFVLTLAAMYALCAYGRRLRTTVTAIGSLLVGAVCAVLLLGLQRIAYLGWDDAIADVKFTFLARTYAASSTGGQDALEQFYSAHRIIFWYDLVDGRAFSSFGAFLSSLFRYGFQVATPMFTVVVLAVIAGSALGFVVERPTSRVSADGLLPTAKVAALFIAWLALFAAVFSGQLVFGVPPVNRWTFLVWDGSVQVATVSTIGALIATFGLARFATRCWDPRRVPLLGTGRVVLLLFGLTVFVRLQYYLYDQSQSLLWTGSLGDWLPAWAAKLAVTGAAVLGSAIALCGSRDAFGRTGRSDLRPALVYAACVAAAYTVLYVASPGNVAYAYAMRFVPLIVFLVDVLIAVALCVCALLVSAGVRAMREASNDHGRAIAAGVVSAWVGVFMVANWVHTQATYVAELPPSLFSSLPSLLREPPFAGASFAVNNDAAVAATFTRQWAYYDPIIASGVTREGYVVARDTQSYLWFADKGVNPDYAHPAYFLCIMPESLVSAAIRARQTGQPEIDRCSALPLVRGALRRSNEFPHQLVARDASGRDAWAIVKIDPAYLLAPGQRPPPSSAGDVATGGNWFPVESFAGETFQWASNDAEVVVTAPTSEPPRLRLDIAAGPGLGQTDFVLDVRDEQDATLARVSVSERQIVDILLPLGPGETRRLHLHVDGGGLPTPGDWRTLNFRVFSLDWAPG